jgi:hypothetical protein
VGYDLDYKREKAHGGPSGVEVIEEGEDAPVDRGAIAGVKERIGGKKWLCVIQ